MEPLHFVRPLCFCTFLLTAVTVPVTPALAQDEGRVVLQLGKPNGSLSSARQFSTAQATDFTMFPSVVSSSLAPYGVGKQKLDLFASCVLQPFGLVVPNCDITIEWRARSGSGGHVHDTNRPPGEFKAETGDTGGSIEPGPPGEVNGNSGSDGFLKVTYTAPEASGVTDLTVRGVAVVFGIPLRFGPDRFTLGVRFGGLARAAGAGLQVNTQSNMHDSNNGFANGTLRTGLQNMAANFAARLGQLGVPPAQVPTIIVTAISLPEGGLFDFDTEWRPPHISHRFGRHADVFVENLAATQQVALANAVQEAGLTTPYAVESPANPAANHWHVFAP